VRRVRASLEAGGFQPEPLQSPWVRQRLNLPESLLLAEMRVLTREGRVLGGADALVYLARELDAPDRPGWAWLLVIVGKIPFAMPVLRAAYAGIAARRYCRQGICSIADSPNSNKEGMQ
jgi:predicted DCC family thiol-disulfide oxidoreductase YuxK